MLGIKSSDRVFAWVRAYDLFHAGLHLAAVSSCLWLALDPVTAALGTALVVEGDHKLKGQPWGQTVRDFAFRLLGGMLGVGLVLLFGGA